MYWYDACVSPVWNVIEITTPSLICVMIMPIKYYYFIVPHLILNSLVSISNLVYFSEHSLISSSISSSCCSSEMFHSQAAVVKYLLFSEIGMV